MSFESLAYYFDRADMAVEAAWAYELALGESDKSLDLFLDLAVLYLVMNDPGYSSAKKLDMSLVDAAYPRALDVLSIAETKLGRSPEIDFWRLHMKERVLGETMPAELYERLVVQGSRSAAVALFAATDKREYRLEAERVFAVARLGDTARKRYLLSFA